MRSLCSIAGRTKWNSPLNKSSRSVSPDYHRKNSLRYLTWSRFSREENKNHRMPPFTTRLISPSKKQRPIAGLPCKRFTTIDGRSSGYLGSKESYCFAARLWISGLKRDESGSKPTQLRSIWAAECPPTLLIPEWVQEMDEAMTQTPSNTRRSTSRRSCCSIRTVEQEWTLDFNVKIL